MTGLLWFDPDKKKPLDKKVAEAAARYQYKFGQRPNLCYVHRSTIDTATQVDGVRVVPARYILKYHFWIGVEEEIELKEVV